jgi:uncharacterized protein (TIGR04255 family)
MSPQHPTYPNPVIEEALCEIHFNCKDGAVWDNTIPSQFYNKISTEFPLFEPITEQGIIIPLGLEGVRVVSGMPTTRQRLRYKHKTGQYLLQLSESVFTVNVFKIYPGWAKVKDIITKNWKEFTEVAPAMQVNRIGLRYINSVPRETPSQKANDWFAESQFVAPQVLSSEPGFLSRVETRFSSSERVIVTFGESESSDFIFDIDCISQREEPVELRDVDSILEKLHDIEWEIFSEVITPKLESYMKRSPS